MLLPFQGVACKYVCTQGVAQGWEQVALAGRSESMFSYSILLSNALKQKVLRFEK
jgi:hypothetical protein